MTGETLTAHPDDKWEYLARPFDELPGKAETLVKYLNAYGAQRWRLFKIGGGEATLFMRRVVE